MKFDKSLLKNKMVLNVIFVIAVLNILGYLAMGNFEAVTLFILVGGLTYFFSKNMIIVLGIPLIIANLYGMRFRSFEGFEGKERLATLMKKKEEELTEEEKTELEKLKKEEAATLTKKEEEASTKVDNLLNDLVDKKDETAAESGFEVGRKKGSSKIDYATTVEDAYADLNKILGGDGIKKLTADTQGLLEQQAQLTKAMGNLGPMMKNMKPMMDNMSSLMENFKQ
jgi:hypothetical protein